MNNPSAEGELVTQVVHHGGRQPLPGPAARTSSLVLVHPTLSTCRVWGALRLGSLTFRAVLVIIISDVAYRIYYRI